jgi:hypothetical protein
MGFNLLSLIMSYPLWTLLCAIFFPAIAAIATFVCLKRAKLHRKMLGFFLIIPLFVILIVVFLSDTGSIMTNLLSSLGLSYPPIVGFVSAIALGIFCLNLTAVICGAGLYKKSGMAVNITATLICLCACIFLSYSTWTSYVELAEAGLLRYDGGVIYVKEVLPFLASLSFLPDFILKSGIELLSLAILALYLLVYFLSFIAIKSPEALVKEDLERRRRVALMNSEFKKPRHSKRSSAEDEMPECCACCEYATALKGDKQKMVCDKCGVVMATHRCKSFLYDPLKRTAVRPLISPSSEFGDLGDEDHI